MVDHKYGRGKFVPHSNYIAYMKMIVNHSSFHDMPNSKGTNGRINWQVSSGIATSFYRDYLARKEWWVKKADALQLSGKDDENDRFTMAARLINPTGYRACRLCGENFNVGYFYVNKNLEKKLLKNFPGIDIVKGQPINDVIEKLSKNFEKNELDSYFRSIFPEREKYFNENKQILQVFEKSMHVRSSWLTPGFMGNPPDRLDGFHDYHFACRKINDPGRSDANMKSYIHDRRSFEWWAEGNWAVADAIYNSAGAGKCSISACEEELKVVSPDHVGPIACGFKQLGLFVPTCPSHNSAKNRRFTSIDTKILIDYEENNNESVASWQIRSHWNKYKLFVQNDSQTKSLSNSLRSLQDMYLRTLWELFCVGEVRLLATLLHPEYAYLDVEIVDFDPGMLTFSKINTSERITSGRKSLAARTIRIAFEALEEYASKSFEKRKMVRPDFHDNSNKIQYVINKIKEYSNPIDKNWIEALSVTLSAEKKEEKISKLFVLDRVPEYPSDITSKYLLQELFDEIGNNSEINFSRYAQFIEAEE